MKKIFMFSLVTLVTSGLVIIPSVASIRSISENHNSFISLLATRFCTGTTPGGTIIPTTGTFKGEKINYEDPRGKHTCFTSRTQSQLEALIKSPSTTIEKEFSQAFKNKNKSVATEYGSQLNKESGDNYAVLLKDALEKGRYDQASSKLYYTAEFIVGADTDAGVFTKNLRIDGVRKGGSNGVHMFPFN